MSGVEALFRLGYFIIQFPPQFFPGLRLDCDAVWANRRLFFARPGSCPHFKGRWEIENPQCCFLSACSQLRCSANGPH